MEKKTGDLDTHEKNKAIMELLLPLLNDIEERLKGYFEERDSEEEGSVKYKAYDELITETLKVQSDVLGLLNEFMKN